MNRQCNEMKLSEEALENMNDSLDSNYTMCRCVDYIECVPTTSLKRS